MGYIHLFFTRFHSFQIHSVEYTGGDSNIVSALRMVRTEVLSSTTNRPEVEDIVIVMIGDR